MAPSKWPVAIVAGMLSSRTSFVRPLRPGFSPGRVSRDGAARHPAGEHGPRLAGMDSRRGNARPADGFQNGAMCTVGATKA